jgi:hypothetical protein
MCAASCDVRCAFRHALRGFLKSAVHYFKST